MLIADTTLTCSHAVILDGRAGNLLFTLIFPPITSPSISSWHHDCPVQVLRPHTQQRCHRKGTTHAHMARNADSPQERISCFSSRSIYFNSIHTFTPSIKTSKQQPPSSPSLQNTCSNTFRYPTRMPCLSYIPSPSVSFVCTLTSCHTGR